MIDPRRGTMLRPRRATLVHSRQGMSPRLGQGKFRHRRRVALLVVLALSLAAAGCGSSSTSSGGSSTGATTQSAGTPVSGGNLVIARQSDSLSMDKETVFDNESIWIFEQMFQMLYTVAPSGKGVVPQLATSYTLSPNKLKYTFNLRQGVEFSNGKPMTSADVVFSIDRTRAAAQGWGYIDAAIKSVTAAGPYKVIITTKYPWAPLLADIALFANGVVPNNYGGETATAFYQHPIGTGPFEWGYWHKLSALQLVRNPHYWQKGLPYLNSVTWTDVANTNTRQLQLQGNQAQIDEFPPFATVAELQNLPGVTLHLFPSTRTDYLLMNEQLPQLKDVHVRRAISYAIDRSALVHAVLFGHGSPANSFMPPQVPYYDANSPGLQYSLASAKQEMAQSKYPHGFSIQLLVGSGNAYERSIAQIIQSELGGLGIKVTLDQVDSTTEQTDQQQLKYQMGLSYWTMDIADPDELVSFAVDPGQGAKSFYTEYSSPQVISETHAAERTFDTTRRQSLYSQIQAQAAHDAFMGFLYYSPYAYAATDKVHGFFVYPTGNYHVENIWLSK
jgi:peptide/nickel transport system substrate-binding protein